MQALILKILTYVLTLPFLAGYRTYLVAAGLLGKAIYDVSVGEYPQAVTDFLGFLAAVGVRAAVARGQVAPKVSVVLVALLLAASGGFAAEPVYEQTLVGEVGPPVANYYTAQIQDLAKKEKRPLVLFRGGAKPRHIVRARCCYAFPNERRSILVAAVADPLQMSACLPGDATDEQIYEAVKQSIAGLVMHAPAAAPDVTTPPVTIDHTGASIRVFRNDRASETITLPADATEAQVKAACVKLAPEVYQPAAPPAYCPPQFQFRPLTLGGS